MELSSRLQKSELGNVPEDWQLGSVASMGDVVTGKALAAHAAGQQRPYLRTKNVFDGRIDITDVLTMPMTEAQFNHFMVRVGDVLLNEGQSLELVGRCAIYQGELDQLCAIQNQLIRFRANKKCSSWYASHLFRFAQQTGVFARVAFQTTSIAHLGGKRFADLILPWPPTLKEQEKIACVLNDIDALIGRISKLISKKRDIRDGAMQRLLTGRTRLPGFNSKWRWKALGSISKSFSGGTPATSVREYYDGSIPWITSSDLNKGTIFDVPGRISQSGLKNSAAKLVKPGTLLIALYGATAGVPAITQIGAAINQAVLAIIPYNDDPKFIYRLLSLQREAFVEKYTQGGQPNLSGAIVKSFVMFLPDAAEQIAISSILDDMDSELFMLELRLNKTRTIKQAMMQALLTGRVRLPVKRDPIPETGEAVNG